MKKLLYTLSCLSLVFTVHAQEDQKKAEFDSKYRFGLRITPQPTWFVSGNKNAAPAGAVFGFGFGLNMEYRFSNIACLLTGVGGDFEGGKYTVKYEPGVYEATYWHDEAGEFIKPREKAASSDGYVLKERKVNATYGTVPLILKLSTQEYSGLKYFGMFGVEISARLNAKSTDTYYKLLSYKGDSVSVLSSNEGEITDVNLKPETFPIRLAMNAGLGAEYRIAGSTSLFVSFNFFRNFTNVMFEESDYMYYKEDAGAYKYVKTNLKLTGLRINVGIMF